MNNKKRIDYISNTLNKSTSKNTCSFSKAERFQMPKSFSPNKFYDLPSTIGRQSQQSRFWSSTQKLQNSYTLLGQFETKVNYLPNNATTFGISREEYYKSKQSTLSTGPGSYQINDTIAIKPFYMGRRIEQPKSKSPLSSASYVVKDTSYNKLSTHRNETSNYKLKTEYHSKHKLKPYDNQVPGPGTYNRKDELSNIANKIKRQYRKKTNSSFGVGERMKKPKGLKIGPGAYNIFSQFGQNY